MDLSFIAHASLLGYLAVFAAGVLTSLGPCNLTTIPLIVAFVGGQRNPARRNAFSLSMAFAIGLAITLTLIGVLASAVGFLTLAWQQYWYYLIAAVCIVMGLHWLQVIALPLPDWGAEGRARIKSRGIWGALLLGLASGLVASGCATPATAAIVTVVMPRGNVAYGASLLLTYGLGRGVPIVLFGTFAGWLKVLPQLALWTERLERASGALMVAVGLYFLWIA